MKTVTETRKTHFLGNESTVRHAAAAFAFTSQVIHLWVLPTEIVFAFLSGLFFLTVAIGQGLLGVSLLFDPRKWAISLGVLFNLSIASVWVVTRLVSLPGITGTVDPQIGILGLTATIAEVGLVILLLTLSRGAGFRLIDVGRLRR
jgi:hypothetical protein